jgi:hypothetical protein
MTTNLNDILSQFHKFCRELSESVCVLPAGSSSFAVETMVLERVVAIGAEAMKAYFAAQAPHFHSSTARDSEGRALRYSDERVGLYYSIFGEIRFKRSYYCGHGQGLFPMDAALNLPPRGASDLQRMMLEELSLGLSYEGATAFLAKYFPVSISTRAVQEVVRTDSLDAEAYYVQASVPTPVQAANILVVQADGKGIPIVKRQTDATAPPEPGKPKGAPKREGKKKEATVVSVSTHRPFLRTAEQIVAGLFDKESYCDEERTIACKREWATMHGKQSAIAQGQTWAEQLGGSHITDHVTLSDGLPSLQRALDEAFPHYTRVLDLMHAIGYLWKAADAWFGGSSPHGRDWARSAVLLMLQGQVASIVEEIDDWAKRTRNAGKVALENAANYFRNNLDAMHYDQYLANGWPIATGIIEGACRHIVKDRCEKSGMRWTGEGVEAILHLRCIYINGDWDAYHKFRMRQRHQEVYGITVQPHSANLETEVHTFNPTNQRAIAV